MAEPYQQELLELRAIVAQQVRDIDQLKRTGGTATWLDRCAWAAMQGMVGVADTEGPERKARLAQTSYEVAQAMLTEKRKREGAP